MIFILVKESNSWHYWMCYKTSSHIVHISNYFSFFLSELSGRHGRREMTDECQLKNKLISLKKRLTYIHEFEQDRKSFTIMIESNNSSLRQMIIKTYRLHDYSDFS